MIKLVSGDIFNSDCNILINTVNCIGVMGTGVAKGFRSRYPDMYKKYRSECLAGQYRPGMIREYNVIDGHIVINFATKDHWSYPSKLEWISDGLDSLHKYLEGTTYSIAIPALGCNNGKLDWNIVRELIVIKLSDLSNRIDLYTPMGIR